MAMSARQFKDLMDTAVEANIITRSAGTMFNTAGEVYFAADAE
jgi:hypothetical protein